MLPYNNLLFFNLGNPWQRHAQIKTNAESFENRQTEDQIEDERPLNKGLTRTEQNDTALQENERDKI